MKTPVLFVDAIQALMRNVPQEVRNHFQIAQDGSFVLESVLIETLGPNSEGLIASFSTRSTPAQVKYSALGRTQYGHILGTKTYHSAPEDTTTLKLQTQKNQ